MKNKIFKSIGVLLLVGFLFTVGASAVEQVRANNTTGTESAYHQDNSDMFALITICAIAIPAIHSMRMTTSLGFKNLVARPDGGVVTDLQNFLMSYLSKYGQDETKKAIDQGKIFFDPVVYYIRYAIG